MAKKKVNAQDEILKKLMKIERNQAKMMKMQERILEKEEKIFDEELVFEDLEKQELKGEKRLEEQAKKELEKLKEIEQLEESIKKDVGEHPLRRITAHDVTKGVIGAFFGIVGHFVFAKGVEIAEHYSYLRSTLLLITSFIIIILFLYFAGFRRIDEKLLFKFLPMRAIVLYSSAIITIFIVLTLYGKISFSTPFHIIYNTVAAISILAVMGAGTADLIGKNE